MSVGDEAVVFAKAELKRATEEAEKDEWSDALIRIRTLMAVLESLTNAEKP